MIKRLWLQNVGPMAEMTLDLAPRLNMLTGDNGLGKTFVLDAAWWALTRTWAGYPARPSHPEKPANIAFTIEGKAKDSTYQSAFDRTQQAWTGKAGRPVNPGLVLYAQADGGFSVWDPARNYWRKKGNADVQERQPAYLFTPNEVWNGMSGRGENPTPLCNGLIRDWASWQRERGEAYKQLTASLEGLSPKEHGKLTPGELTRISLDDARDMPTLQTPYSQQVPIVHASSGVRRVVALAYLLVWAWREHVAASKLLGQENTQQIIFLIDEVEAHLHPRWQRTIVKSILATVRALISNENVNVQLLAATHSPLVLSSIETIFDENQDAWFDFDLVLHDVTLLKRAWVRHGEMNNWLTSEAFDLPSAYPIDTETVIEKASIALSNANTDAAQFRALDQELRSVLSPTDTFWTRWRFVGQRKGWLP